MKKLVALLILLTVCASASAQVLSVPEVGGRTFEGCRIDDAESGGVETTVQCTLDSLDGKPAELRFPTSEFRFGSQCAVVETSLSRWEVARYKVYDPPFTLILTGGQWRYDRKPYSLCEMALHRTARNCIGHDDPHNISPWLRCPVQNITRP